MSVLRFLVRNINKPVTPTQVTQIQVLQTYDSHSRVIQIEIQIQPCFADSQVIQIQIRPVFPTQN